jgi:hypothetical protein
LFLLHVNPTSEGRARSSTNIKNRSQPWSLWKKLHSSVINWMLSKTPVTGRLPLSFMSESNGDAKTNATPKKYMLQALSRLAF